MKVLSDLAEIEFSVGDIKYINGQLVIESDRNSTMSTQILVSRSDARATIIRFLKSGSVWRFLVSLPFSRGKRAIETNHNGPESEKWAERRSKTGINKPW